ncbi:MAG TPA: hypothetical protein DCY48_02310 [Candidatus Magasanikbacteria bacterium]|nr:MAG: hypothetical protein A3I74_01225 [Candidatus Magasanikbacteria bacterium RIFCSPLOWO2_02_FULL_47_16]OGH79935.1 MAG: hypothetical protein A3C10_02000 [Candidatus Magasanikbacteria bacterium RIFCSPHIGHO2_02_FULL_48_18]HAZ28589.1 hypothetical protein [Candidatus Magasanikbacteria bacterium]
MQEFIETLLKEAGDMAKAYFYKGVTHKTKSNLADLLTEADLAVSDFLVRKIHEAYPDDHIHSEEMEKDINPGSFREWVIDPIDGTLNFAKGIPSWCHLLAVVEDKETLYGAAYHPIAQEFFFGEKNHGATMNRMPIRVSQKDSFDFAIGHGARFPTEDAVYGTHIEQFKEYFRRLNLNTNVWIQHHGSMIGACYVASGGLDFFLQNAGLDHDYLAPALLCEEAGAVVTDSEGNPWKRGRQDIVIANPTLHKKLMALFA